MFIFKAAFCRFFASLVIALSVVTSTQIFAQQVLPGTYASWTPEQIKQAAALLKSGSSVACQKYTDAAKENLGSQKSSYESAVCIGAYYVNHLPPDDPNLDAIKKGVMANYESAKALNSDIPVPFVSASPSPPPKK